MAVTLYAKPHCPQCRATRRQFDKLGVDYHVVDLTQDAGALQHFVAAGYRQAPIVVAGAETWSGFRPDRIKRIAAAKAASLVTA